MRIEFVCVLWKGWKVQAKPLVVDGGHFQLKLDIRILYLFRSRETHFMADSGMAYDQPTTVFADT